MTTLVTGGAGYIGAHVVRALVGRAARVVVLDSLCNGRRDAVPGAVPFVRGDIRNRELVGRLLTEYGVGSVVHLAADKSVGRSMVAPGPVFENNVAGTLTLLQAMSDAGVSQLVFSSSCAIYGTPERLPIDEGARIHPGNPYGESKAIDEQMIGWFDRLAGIRTVALRYFNAAGAHPDGDLGEAWDGAENLIPVVLRAAWTGVPVRVFGTNYETPDGTAVRDYVHVVDLAEAHLRALDHLASSGPSQALNLGTGRGFSVREVIDEARAVTGRAIRVQTAPRRPGDAAAVWADPRQAAEVLGWRATRDLRDMLSSAWSWHTGESHQPQSLPRVEASR